MMSGPDRKGGLPLLPKRIGRLNELAYNLWWSWHEDARQVFRSLDYARWRATDHNPVKELRDIGVEKLQAAATDPAFLELYDSVMARFDADMVGDKLWFGQAHGGHPADPVAYFSPEFAIHGSLPIYAGGLGVLAGDICKEASDLGVPLVGVGFMYPQGYFHQHVSVEGWQQEIYTQLNFDEAPIARLEPLGSGGPLASVRLADRDLFLAAWLVRVGRVRLYLLDTNVAENSPGDRTLCARLYTTDPDHRVQQLIVLGMGGVKVLRALGINPVVWHANEDHTAFMVLERLREEMAKGSTFDQALANVRASTVFTTHTPVAAGHNIFPKSLIESYFHGFWESSGIERQAILRLGEYQGLEPGKFSLTALALRLSVRSNAVSRLHGGVTRRMWHNLWPHVAEAEVPIMHITNGVHLPSWQAPEVTSLCRKYPGDLSGGRHDDPGSWGCIMEVPDDEFWEMRQVLKTRLVRLIQERAQQRWAADGIPTDQVLAMGTLLAPYPLTIAFSRRFTEYKRPGLIVSDMGRLKRILNDPLRPVQLIFAGKSHPQDSRGKELVRQVYLLARDCQFQGRIAFVEDYDMHLCRELVKGVDVWLNNPRRLQEASGTSGMKASMNGVIHLSVRDGWWDEGYSGTNGWSLDGAPSANPSAEDRGDAEALYRLLEEVIVPMYYDRDRKGVPHRWVQMAKEAIRTVSPNYCAGRMVKEYTEHMYFPAGMPAKVA